MSIPSGGSAGDTGAKSSPRQTLTLPEPSFSPKTTRNEPISAFLAWPSFLFEKMLSPHVFRPFIPWLEMQRPNRATSLPQTEKRETATQCVYRVALPGIEAGQISLYFSNNAIVMTIREEKKRHQHAIHRAFSVPTYTDSEMISARLKNGILTIIIPKTSKPIASKSSYIPIT